MSSPQLWGKRVWCFLGGFADLVGAGGLFDRRLTPHHIYYRLQRGTEDPVLDFTGGVLVFSLYGSFDIVFAISCVFPSPMPPHTLHVTKFTWCSCVRDVDWCLQSDAITNSRRQGPDPVHHPLGLPAPEMVC